MDVSGGKICNERLKYKVKKNGQEREALDQYKRSLIIKSTNDMYLSFYINSICPLTECCSFGSGNMALDDTIR